MIAPTRLRYLLAPLLLVPVVLATALVAGCGTTEPPRQPPPAPAQISPVTLPWPVSDPAGISVLQKRVDGGAQPWLLEPESVAVSFATAAYGWQDSRAVIAEGGAPANTTVELSGPNQQTARVLLEQPGRTGVGGIWVVTTASGP